MINTRDELGRIVGKPKLTKTCPNCHKAYITFASQNRNYCSQKCYWKFMPKHYVGEKSSHWKGDKVQYIGLHMWIKKQLGKPSKCEKCGTEEPRMYHWANKSGNYSRDLSDWIRLCVPCHKRYDLSH